MLDRTQSDTCAPFVVFYVLLSSDVPSMLFACVLTQHSRRSVIRCLHQAGVALV